MNYNDAKNLVAAICERMNELDRGMTLTAVRDLPEEHQPAVTYELTEFPKWEVQPGTDNPSFKAYRSMRYFAYMARGGLKIMVSANFGGYNTVATRDKLCVGPALPTWQDLWLEVEQKEALMAWDRPAESLAKDILRRVVPNALEVYAEYLHKSKEQQEARQRMDRAGAVALAGIQGAEYYPEDDHRGRNRGYIDTYKLKLQPNVFLRGVGVDGNDSVRFDGLSVSAEMANKILKMISKEG